MRTKKVGKTIIGFLLVFSLMIGFCEVESYLKTLQRNTEVDQKTSVMAATKVSTQEEMRAVWISYLEFQSAKMSKMSDSQFKHYVDGMFDKCVSLGMNAVIVQVRPFGDALYESDYFPWSVIATGKQGKSPKYDPLEIMVTEAHARGLEFHAWVNPYRVTLSAMKLKSLSSDNQAKKWIYSKDKAKNRNVLYQGGMYYYNPAKKDVQELITNGITEIVEKYDVDGIHFDDYFYPALGSRYKTSFDAKEYEHYRENCKDEGVSAKSIINWRRENVNTLLATVYASIKDIKPEVTFGVSPAGNINNLYAKDRYYCDVKKWMSQSGYVDYICPQIYWSFIHKVCPYNQTVKKWTLCKKNNQVRLYIGLAAYRAGINKRQARSLGDMGWSRSNQELLKQVKAARKYSKIDGFVFFRYDDLVSSTTKKEVTNLKKAFR